MVDHPSKLLQSFDLDIVREICAVRTIPIDDDETKKGIIKKILEHVTHLGIKLVVGQLKKPEMVTLATALEVFKEPGDKKGDKEKDSGTKGKTKSAMTKKITEVMVAKGASSCLDKAFNTETLKRILTDSLKVEDVPDKKKDLVDSLVHEIETVGLEVVLGALPIDTLKAMVSARKLKVHSDSKNILIDSLITDSNYTPPASKKQEKVSAKKPKIEKGVTKTDLNNWYYRKDLATWCEENKIKASGTKKELINRIASHFAGTLKDSPKKSKKRKAGGARGKKRPAKKAKTGAKKKAEEKKSDDEGEKE